MTGPLVPQSSEQEREARVRCGCLPCLIELRLADLVRAVEHSPMTVADIARVVVALGAAMKALSAITVRRARR